MDLPPLEEHLTFLSPISEQRASRLVAWLADGLGDGTLLDVGCGWGELALRVASAAPDGHVVGVDLDAERIARATLRARERGLEDRTEFLVGDGASTGPSGVDALVAIGASQVWAQPAAAEGPLDYAAALGGIRRRVHRGARVVYADGVWSHPPTPAATAPLGGRHDEFLPMADLVLLTEEHEFAVVAVGQATQEEWDDFESGFTARYATWLAGHDPDHPQATEVRARARAQREGYLRGYRGVLGLAYLQLLAV